MKLRPQQFPSPGPSNTPHAAKQFICVIRDKDEVREVETIEVERLAEYEAEGWCE